MEWSHWQGEEDEERRGRTDGGGEGGRVTRGGESTPNTGRSRLHVLNRKFSHRSFKAGPCTRVCTAQLHASPPFALYCLWCSAASVSEGIFRIKLTFPLIDIIPFITTSGKPVWFPWWSSGRLKSASHLWRPVAAAPKSWHSPVESQLPTWTSSTRPTLLSRYYGLWSKLFSSAMLEWNIDLWTESFNRKHWPPQRILKVPYDVSSSTSVPTFGIFWGGGENGTFSLETSC